MPDPTPKFIPLTAILVPWESERQGNLPSLNDSAVDRWKCPHGWVLLVPEDVLQKLKREVSDD